MKLLRTILPATQLLAPTACAVHTGFAYGAFWTESQPKVKADFLRLFNLAKNLPGVPVSFNSARLFQTSQWMKDGEPSEAFDAAVETNTTLLLGLWLSKLDQELIALDKAFDKHGQSFADLVVGISVGNEDIYRNSPDCTRKDECNGGFSKEDVLAKIKGLQAAFPQKLWWKLFKMPPLLGHTDIAKYAGMEGLDFAGTTIYPVWNRDPIDKANESFFNSLDMVQRNAGKAPVWITETGWPAAGKVEGTSEASVANLQKFWKDVGCSIFAKHNVWWFQLERDTDGASNGFDWGLIDKKTQKPYISDLSCPQVPSVSPAPSPSQPPAPPSQPLASPSPPSSNPLSSILATTPSPSVPTLTPTGSSAPSSSPSSSGKGGSSPPPARTTVCTTTTVVVTLPASASHVPKVLPPDYKRRVRRY